MADVSDNQKKAQNVDISRLSIKEKQTLRDFDINQLGLEELKLRCAILEQESRSKDRTIQGQNITIQTLSAQNFALRDLLKQVENFEHGLFSGDKWKRLKERITERLKEISSGKNKNVGVLDQDQQISIFRDLLEQVLNLETGLFGGGKLNEMKNEIRKAFDTIKGKNAQR